MRRVDEGHTFPLNPKWVLCDPGWKRVWDKLMSSDNECTQRSLDIWYPPSSGIRERVEEIYQRHPNGFQQLRHPGNTNPSVENARNQQQQNGFWRSILHATRINFNEQSRAPSFEGTEAMDLAEQELKYHLILTRAKLKRAHVHELDSASSSHINTDNKDMEPSAPRANAGSAVSLVAGSW